MKQKIIYILIGIAIAVFGFHAYTIYQVRKQTIINTQNIQQIINFLNSQIKQ